MNDLAEAIDEYNAAVDLRANPIVPSMEPVIEIIVEDHLRKFERLLAACDDS